MSLLSEHLSEALPGKRRTAGRLLASLPCSGADPKGRDEGPVAPLDKDSAKSAGALNKRPPLFRVLGASIPLSCARMIPESFQKRRKKM